MQVLGRTDDIARTALRRNTFGAEVRVLISGQCSSSESIQKAPLGTHGDLWSALSLFTVFRRFQKFFVL